MRRRSNGHFWQLAKISELRRRSRSMSRRTKRQAQAEKSSMRRWLQKCRRSLTRQGQRNGTTGSTIRMASGFPRRTWRSCARSIPTSRSSRRDGSRRTRRRLEKRLSWSRELVRGDFEDASKIRADASDAPTCSQTMISTVFSLACRDVICGPEASPAAFLQGFQMDQILVLKMPKGLPEVDSDDYYVVSITVYGTKAVVSVGLWLVPHEQSAFVLNDKSGGIAGLAIVHVDDIFYGHRR